MQNKREELINELMALIDEDLAAIHKAESNALENDRHDDFINLAKRFDKVANTKAALRSYGSSMISFDYVYGR